MIWSQARIASIGRRADLCGFNSQGRPAAQQLDDGPQERGQGKSGGDQQHTQGRPGAPCLWPSIPRLKPLSAACGV